MTLQKGDIIQATIEDIVVSYLFHLSYKSYEGIISLEELAWVIRDDFFKVGDTIRVEVTNTDLRFRAVHKPLKKPPPSKTIGYWELHWTLRDRYDPTSVQHQFPHPRILVNPSWQVSNKEKIINYLNAGWTHTQWRGVSFCRFECDIENAKMGSKCLTDGEWSWPEGLAHYIEKHDVQLPEDFIDTMKKYDWDANNRYAKDEPVPRGELDYSYWVEWCAQFKHS